MYQLFTEGQLLGYTYNDTAAKTFKLIADRNHVDCTIITVKDQGLPLKENMVKTPEHINNLVEFYRRQGYPHVAWKYMVFNRQIIPHFRHSFMKEFDKVYEGLLIEELNDALNELL